jgi:sarcosine oxidase gamma subunit
VNFRHFVLVEPFGPNDFTIFAERDERKAHDLDRAYRETGKRTRFVTSSGTVTDLRLSLKQARAAMIEQLACALSAPTEGA